MVDSKACWLCGETGNHDHFNGTYIPIPERVSQDDVIYGWRLFSIIYDDSLMSPITYKVWYKNELEADCKSIRHPDSPSPQYECYCGIYLLKNEKDLDPLPLITSYSAAYAYCSAWGHIIEHEDGYRVQHCRIERLKCPSIYAKAIAARYDLIPQPEETALRHRPLSIASRVLSSLVPRYK